MIFLIFDFNMHLDTNLLVLEDYCFACHVQVLSKRCLFINGYVCYSTYELCCGACITIIVLFFIVSRMIFGQYIICAKLHDILLYD
jgi:hypothetical protein